MTPPPATDPNIDHLEDMMAQYRSAQAELEQIRNKIYIYVQELKRQGYSYPVLAKTTGFAVANIQKIVAKGAE